MIIDKDKEYNYNMSLKQSLLNNPLESENLHQEIPWDCLNDMICIIT